MGFFDSIGKALSYTPITGFGLIGGGGLVGSGGLARGGGLPFGFGNARPSSPSYQVPDDPKKPKYSTDIQSQFVRVLGREARPDEIEYFKQAVDKGDLSPYEVGEILTGTQEYQTRLLSTQGQDYTRLLAANDSDVLRRAEDQISGSLARQGRGGSSSYTAAFANAARDLAIARQSQLGDFYKARLGGLANQGVQGSLMARGRAAGLADETRQRQYDLQDFYRQANYNRDWLDYMDRQNRRKSEGAFLGSIAGGALGLGLSGGNPFGGFAGAQVGSQLGNFY